jgi:hypothetical protein
MDVVAEGAVAGADDAEAAGATVDAADAAGAAREAVVTCAAEGCLTSGHSERPEPGAQLTITGSKAPIRPVIVDHMRAP